MHNQLQTLITNCEKEKTLLQKSIDDCLEEMDYLGAHYYAEALFIINRKLQTLYNIEDPNHDMKSFKQGLIKRFQKISEAEESDGMKSYYERTIQDTIEELDVLNQAEKPIPLNNETLLFDTLEKLMDNKVKNVKLVLKKSDNLLFAFTYSKRTLRVTLPYVKQLSEKWVINEENIISFKNLGFSLNESGTKFILSLKGDKVIITTGLKLILSKVIFEIFYFREFSNESYILFTEK